MEEWEKHGSGNKNQATRNPGLLASCIGFSFLFHFLALALTHLVHRGREVNGQDERDAKEKERNNRAKRIMMENSDSRDRVVRVNERSGQRSDYASHNY